MPKDPNLYREMSVPFPSADAMEAAMKAFHEEVGGLRKKHKVADVLIVVSGAYADGSEEGGESEAMLIFSFGSQLKTPFMAAYAYGHERALLDENIAYVAKQAIKRRKHND